MSSSQPSGGRSTPRTDPVAVAIRSLEDDDLEALIEFSLEAWAPVFASFEAALGSRVYGLLFPHWRSAQADAIRATCTAPEIEVSVALAEDRPVGFVAFGLIDEDAARAGEVHMIAVDPAHQGDGIGTALMQTATDWIKGQGVELVVAATGGDPGHAPARALYERLGFTPLPLVRYYRTL